MIGFTGTQRGWTAPQSSSVERVFTELIKDGEWMNNGDCEGADTEAYYLWKKLGGLVHGCPPDNPKKRSFLKFDSESPLEPYPKRNKNIVNRSRALVATPGEMDEHRRSGTWSTVRYARSVGIRIIIVFPDGSIVEEPPKGIVSFID